MGECQHDFKGLEYSKLLERWVTFCHCGLIKEEEPEDPNKERIQRARKSRIKNGDIPK